MKKYFSNILKEILTLCIVVCMPLQICACNKTEITTTPLPDKQEMIDQIHEYEKQAKFTSAIEIYRQMHEYGYITDADLDKQEKQYYINSYMCNVANFAIKHLKEELKDPHSLVVYGMDFELCEYDESGMIISITVDYGATNSFGGMVRDDYIKRFCTTERPEHWDDTLYIITHTDLSKESQFEAIINEEAEYDSNFQYKLFGDGGYFND